MIIFQPRSCPLQLSAHKTWVNILFFFVCIYSLIYFIFILFLNTEFEFSSDDDDGDGHGTARVQNVSEVFIGSQNEAPLNLVQERFSEEDYDVVRESHIRSERAMIELSAREARTHINTAGFANFEKTIQTLLKIWCDDQLRNLTDIFQRVKIIYGNGDFKEGNDRNQAFNCLFLLMKGRLDKFSKPFVEFKMRQTQNKFDQVTPVGEGEGGGSDDFESAEPLQQVSGLGRMRDFEGYEYSETDCLQLRKKLARIVLASQQGFELVEKAIRAYYNSNPSNSPYPVAKLDQVFGVSQNDGDIAVKEPNQVQNLILHLTEVTRKECLRKFSGSVYEPIHVNVTSAEGFSKSVYTHCYRERCSFMDFVYRSCPVESKENWKFLALTSSNSAARQCEGYLEKCQSDSFPVLLKRRDRFAFWNGILEGSLGKFFSWDELEYDALKDPHAVCARYFECDFDLEVLRCEHEEELGDPPDPMGIPTPLIDKIMQDQNFKPDTMRWLYAFIGRMFVFDDRWEKAIMFQGTAGTGKSTLLTLIKDIWELSDVGVISNNPDENFPLAHVHDKFALFMIDIDDRFSFDPMLFNSLVSLEPVAMNEKFKNCKVVNPKLPIAMAGNRYPSWPDVSNNLSRRLVPFIFTCSVQKDTKLLEKIRKEELPKFLYKSIKVYLAQKKLVGDRDVAHLLSPQIKKMSLQMQAVTNPIQGFLKDESEVTMSPDGHCLLSRFKKKLSRYVKANNRNRPKKSFDTHEIVAAFANNSGVKIVYVGKKKKKRNRASAFQSSSSSSSSSSSFSPLGPPLPSSSVTPASMSSLSPLQTPSVEQHPYENDYIVGLSLVESEYNN